MVQKIVTFDVALKSTERQWVQKVPEVYTNDLGSVSLQFRITDCNDTELTGSTAIVLLKMRDGSFFQGPSTDVTRTLNAFSYILKENEGNHDGLAEIQLIVTIGAKEFATQKYNFKVISGLDSEIAREIMIYDWSTLTAEARAYIDQFAADEILRDAEFDNNQFDRNVAFNAAQGQRATDFGLAQTQRNTDFGSAQAQRGNDFNAAEAARVLAFNEAETARAAGYDADHSRAETDHTGAVADRANAATDRTNAATDRTNAAADRTLAGTDHTRAESDHTRADADSATVAGFNGRMMALDARTEFEATNTMVNGDFSNGTAGWESGNGAVLSVLNNTLSVAGSTSSKPQAVPNTKLLSQDGTTRLLKFKVRVTNSDCQKISIYVGGSEYIVTSNPIVNQWYSFSKLFAFDNNKIDAYLAIRHTYVDATTANGKVMEVQYVSFINLTATFGAGKEPTLAEMDRLMARFPNSWFDGVKPIQTIETLYQEKANKVQEPWITPTLLNGTTGTVKYRKNEFGMVEGYADLILGTAVANTILFSFATAYYPFGGHMPAFRGYVIASGARTDIKLMGYDVKLAESLVTGNRVYFTFVFPAN